VLLADMRGTTRPCGRRGDTCDDHVPGRVGEVLDFNTKQGNRWHLVAVRVDVRREKLRGVYHA
jgi:hypothetical protein